MSKSSAQPATIYLKDYARPDFLIKTVNLTVELGEKVTTVTSRLSMVRNQPTAKTLSLNGEKLAPISVKLNGKFLAKEAYDVTEEYLNLAIDSDISAFDLEIVTELKPQENTALEGLYKSNGNFCTQCEAEGFRKITYFLDRPDVMAVFTTTIIGDAGLYPVMLSNGNLRGRQELADGRLSVFWHDPHPKPAYLFALVAGDLACVEDHFTTRSGRDVTLQIFVEHGNEDKCGHAMVSLKKSMTWDEEQYGREYDLDIFMIVAVSDFNMGAMENKGLNIFNSKYVLASPETATDADFDGIESVIAHEYFHNWTGNRITCRDWFQLTLKEGLTVFRDQQFSADMNSAAVNRINDVQRLRSAQFPEDAGPLAHPIQPQSYVEINNFYTATVYEKGAEVIRMIHTLLGPTKFRDGMDLYFERHDGQAVTTEEFVAALEGGSGIDLTQFRRWYIQPGTPTITVKEEFDEARGQFRLSLEQSNPKAGNNFKPLQIPVRLGLLDEDGQSIDIPDQSGTMQSETILNFTEKKTVFTFEGIKKRPRISLFRHFSAPVKIKQKMDNDALGFLFAKDTDLFNRWESGQRLATSILLDQIKDFDGRVTEPLPDVFTSAFDQLLADKTLDPAFIALAMTLPSEQDIAQAMPVVDTDTIHTIRNAARAGIGARFENRLSGLYQECVSLEETSNQPGSGIRKLKNTVLRYLAATGQKQYLDLAAVQYDASQNMTDTVAVMSILGDSEEPSRNRIFSDFYGKWQNDPLVIDKWFSLQAMTARSSALDDVTELMSHPAFTFYNPNRVRSLIGAFAAGNPVHFHEKTGRGYKLLSDCIGKLNVINPQIAARMVVPLGQWRRYDANRQQLMKKELEKILNIPDLSNHVYEMANKSLHN
ncbi:MAG: aminopeptidase N [Sneathiella sp.]|nr:MAG: aminopeptidase N [Sneathiella sp.]